MLFKSNLFSDEGSIGYFSLDNLGKVVEVPVLGIKHKGMSGLVDLKSVKHDRFLLEYNIDGCSWLYECRYDEADSKSLEVLRVLCGPHR